MTDENQSDDERKDAVEGPEEEPHEVVDEANPEAIARRVAALDDEDPVERRAREEEQKLAERRAAIAAAKKKGKGKKSGLEVAASKKLSKIGTHAEPRRRLATARDADPLLARTEKLGEWAKKNQRTVQIIGGILAVMLIGIAGYLYYDNKRETAASVLLAKAVADGRGHIGELPKDEDAAEAAEAMGPVFGTFDERRDAALARFREVQAKFPKTGAAILARLAEGSLLLDKKDGNGAFTAYSDVRNSPLAAVDQEVKGRSMEGIGFAYELKANENTADTQKYLDDALRAYKELENTDVQGFKELAKYHQARILEKKGEEDKAKELLLALKEPLAKQEESFANIPMGAEYPYLKEVAMDRLRAIDPTAAPKQGSGGGQQLTPDQIRKLIEDAQKKKAHP
ncbi:MAG: hypothetical protein FWD69_04670 [Polyangiaceae bacterium]|nr:hypothetical protein [Polyangiaceae bacterium]